MLDNIFRDFGFKIFFNSSKILINAHDPFLKRYVSSLVLENKVLQAIQIIKQNYENENIDFFDSYLLLIIDSLKKNELDIVYEYISIANNFADEDRFNLAILESLKQYVYLFKEKKFLDIVEDLTIFVESKDKDGNLKNIYLKDQVKDEESQIIYAKSGKLVSKNNKNFFGLLAFYTNSRK